jgi:hypothetical protein
MRSYVCGAEAANSVSASLINVLDFCAPTGSLTGKISEFHALFLRLQRGNYPKRVTVVTDLILWEKHS